MEKGPGESKRRKAYGLSRLVAEKEVQKPEVEEIEGAEGEKEENPATLSTKSSKPSGAEGGGSRRQRVGPPSGSSQLRLSGGGYIPPTVQDMRQLDADIEEFDMTAQERARQNKFASLLQGRPVDVAQLKRLSWSGVPSEQRADVWRVLLGYFPGHADRRDSAVAQRREEYARSVRTYMDVPPDQWSEDENSTFRQICIDIPRTNPAMIMFQVPRVQRLYERLLYVWAVKHPATGYVQGMNDLVTPFILVFLTPHLGSDVEAWDWEAIPEALLAEVEADAYGSFSALLDRIQDHYTVDQAGIQRLLAKLEGLVKRVDPQLYRHIRSHDVEFMSFAYKWMNCVSGEALVELACGACRPLAAVCAEEEAPVSAWSAASASVGGAYSVAGLRRCGPRAVLAVQFDGGRSLTCTPDHRILGRSSMGGDLGWVEARAMLDHRALFSPRWPVREGGRWNHSLTERELAAARLLGWRHGRLAHSTRSMSAEDWRAVQADEAKVGAGMGNGSVEALVTREPAAACEYWAAWWAHHLSFSSRSLQWTFSADFGALSKGTSCHSVVQKVFELVRPWVALDRGGVENESTLDGPNLWGVRVVEAMEAVGVRYNQTVAGWMGAWATALRVGARNPLNWVRECCGGCTVGVDPIRWMELKVVAVRPAMPCDVFDVCVPGPECFVASGVVVHNCLLLREIPSHLSVRLWDTYLAELDDIDRFHVYVCLSFLLNMREPLLELDYPELLIYLQKPPTANWTYQNLGLLLSKAYELSVLWTDAHVVSSPSPADRS